MCQTGTYDDVLGLLPDLDGKIAKITLKGNPGHGVYFDKSVLSEKLNQNLFFAKVLDETTEGGDTAGVLQSLFLENLSKNAEGRVLELAKRFGIAALRGDKL